MLELQRKGKSAAVNQDGVECSRYEMYGLITT